MQYKEILDEYHSIIKEGKEAYASGKRKTDNPYKEEVLSEKKLAWLIGWKAELRDRTKIVIIPAVE